MDIEKVKAKIDASLVQAVELLAADFIGQQVLTLLANGEELSLPILTERLEAVAKAGDKADHKKAVEALKQIRQHLPASE